MSCVFKASNLCKILKNPRCSEKCKFRKTEEEFTKAQAYSDEILKAKGLERCMIRVGEELIMSTKEDENET